MSNWSVAGTVVDGFIEETRTWDSLQIVWQVDESVIENTLEPELDAVEKFDVVTKLSGGFKVLDRSNGRSEVDLQAVNGHDSIRTIPTWYVSDYSQEPIDQRANKWEVEAVFAPVSEKSYDNSFGTGVGSSVSPADSEWYFTFSQGDIATSNVTTDFSRSPENEFQSLEFTIIADESDAAVMEDSLSKINRFNYREVPDGTDVVEDNSGGDATVGIRPPVGESVTATEGEYAVKLWETFWNGSFYQITIEAVIANETSVV